MHRTITMGNYVSVQGTFVRQLPDGRVEVRVGDKVFAGVPVSRQTAA
ncbi:MAG: hypothetical protein ACU0DK_01015 [Pseudooceanicola sp.]